MSMRRALSLAILSLTLSACDSGPGMVPQPHSANPAAYSQGPVLYDDLLSNLSQWSVELEQPGTVTASGTLGGGTLSINAPAGCTVWFRHELSGPVEIHYLARMIKENPPGPYDRVSDLNCFWMAQDSRAKSDAPEDFFSVRERNGKFSTYDQLTTYYVGQGGNTNTTTRFRRYIGQADNRPLLPDFDLSDKKDLLAPNAWQNITLIADGGLIEYYRDGARVFQYHDDAPYTHGYFGIRTTKNHMEVTALQIIRLVPVK